MLWRLCTGIRNLFVDGQTCLWQESSVSMAKMQNTFLNTTSAVNCILIKRSIRIQYGMDPLLCISPHLLLLDVNYKSMHILFLWPGISVNTVTATLIGTTASAAFFVMNNALLSVTQILPEMQLSRLKKKKSEWQEWWGMAHYSSSWQMYKCPIQRPWTSVFWVR